MLVVDGVKKIDHFSKEEQEQIKQKYEMAESYKDYEKGTFWILVSLVLLLVWFVWLMQFGKLAHQYVGKLRREKEMTHHIFIQSKEQILQVPCIYVSRVKSGYMVMVQNGKTNQLVLYPDRVIYKLEHK